MKLHKLVFSTDHHFLDGGLDDEYLCLLFVFYLVSLSVCKFVKIVVLIWDYRGEEVILFFFIFFLNIYFVGLEFFFFLGCILMFLVFNEACLLVVSLCNWHIGD